MVLVADSRRVHVSRIIPQPLSCRQRDIATSVHSGIATGDVFTAVEIIQGTAYDDSFVGDNAANIFIGGAGADYFDGGGSIDSLWYLTSSAGVTVNLATGAASGGDATGDSFINIESLIGSNFNDTLTAVATGSRLEGGGGNDIVSGGDGSDVIYGGIGKDIGAAGPVPTGVQADTISGGGGNDQIYSAGNNTAEVNYGSDEDAGTTIDGDAGNDTIVIGDAIAHGGSDNDTITVWSTGTAYGDAGNDILNGEYIGFHLYGGDGADRLNLKLGEGFADGENGGDSYYTDTVRSSTIKDTGTGGNDYVYLQKVASFGDLRSTREGDDLVLASQNDIDTEYDISVVILEDWYAGYNTIEFFVLADGTQISGSLIA